MCYTVCGVYKGEKRAWQAWPRAGGRQHRRKRAAVPAAAMLHIPSPPRSRLGPKRPSPRPISNRPNEPDKLAPCHGCVGRVGPCSCPRRAAGPYVRLPTRQERVHARLPRPGCLAHAHGARGWGGVLIESRRAEMARGRAEIRVCRYSRAGCKRAAMAAWNFLASLAGGCVPRAGAARAATAHRHPFWPPVFCCNRR